MNWKKLHPGWILAAAVVMVGATLWLSPRSLPLLLILLVCPAAMFFMMRGMSHGASGQGHEPGNGHAEYHGGHEDEQVRR